MITDNEKRTEKTKGEMRFDLMLGTTLRKEPLAANPRSAMLTTMNAKWYHRDTEKIRVNEISKRSAAAEMKKMPQ